MTKLIPVIDRVPEDFLLGCVLLRNTIILMARGTQVQGHLRMR